MVRKGKLVRLIVMVPEDPMAKRLLNVYVNRVTEELAIENKSNYTAQPMRLMSGKALTAPVCTLTFRNHILIERTWNK